MAEDTSRMEPAIDEAVTISQPGLREYGGVALALGGLALLLARITALRTAAAPRPEVLLGPVFALVALIGVVWLCMLIARNYATLRGRASARYFAEYRAADAPPDWVERPARTYDNLMQLPALFFLLCTLMMLTRTLDAPQLVLAWTFVALRAVHALVYIVWNYLPARFGSFVAGFLTLALLWLRFAQQTWHLL